MKSGLIYLLGQIDIPYEDSDQSLPFRQRRYFYYMSGVTYPGCALTYDIEADILRLWIPPPSPISSAYFNGQVPSAAEFKKISHVDHVTRIKYLPRFILDYYNDEEGQIYLLHPAQKDDILSFEDKRRFDTVKLLRAMDDARSIKSSYEIGQIKKANAVSASAHKAVLCSLRHLDNEADIEAIFAATCISQQAKKQAYEIIAGAGVNASTLHYGANDAPLAGKQLVCLDAGCEWQCYSSDITRTFPISGTWSPEAKAIHDLVTKMQDECIEMVKPGADYR